MVFVKFELKKGLKEDVSDETSIGSFTKFGSPWVKACVIQNGRCSVVAGGLKGFSMIFADVGVEPKNLRECSMCFVVLESVGYFELYN